MANSVKAEESQQARTPLLEENKPSEQMCCDRKRTAAQHRKESSDGKCCSDS